MRFGRLLINFLEELKLADESVDHIGLILVFVYWQHIQLHQSAILSTYACKDQLFIVRSVLDYLLEPKDKVVGLDLFRELLILLPTDIHLLRTQMFQNITQ